MGDRGGSGLGDGGIGGVFCKWKCPGRDIRAQVTHVWREVQGEGGLLDPRGWGFISDLTLILHLSISKKTVSPLRSSLYCTHSDLCLSVWAPPPLLPRSDTREVRSEASIYSAGYHPSASRGRPLAITPPHPLDKGQVRV